MSEKKDGVSICEFLHQMDMIAHPIVALAKLKEENKDELRDLGIVKDNPKPKWKRRRKGEKRESDKWDYGEKR